MDCLVGGENDYSAGTTTMPIERETNDWGIRLLVRPFPASHRNAEMEIRADIPYPREKHSGDMRFWFKGTLPAEPLALRDTVAWIEAMRAVVQQAGEEFKAMKEKAGESSTRSC